MAEKEIKQLVRIANVDLDGNKQILVALTKIKGVGISLANAALQVAKVEPTTLAGTMTSDQEKKIEAAITDPTGNGIPSWMINRQNDYETGENRHLLNADLNFEQDNDIKRLMRVKANRGLRHSWKLPVRGQRTQSNFRRSKSKAVSGAKKGRKSRA